MKKYSLYLILFFSCFLFSNLKTIAGGVSATLTAHFYPGGFNITCNGLNDGGFDISIAGGGPFDVDITKNGSAFYTNHNTSLTFISLASLGAGEYVVTVYDQFDQSQVIPSITLIEPHPLSVSADPVLLPPCNYMISTVGGSDGKIFANATGGTPGYSYVWSTGHTTISIGSLPAGTYSVTVTDGNFCTSSSSATLVDPPTLSTSLSSPTHNSYQVSCYQGRDGEIIANAVGGCPPYEYNWDGVGFSQNDHPTGLSAGNHTVIVRDAQGAITGGAIDLYQAPKITAEVTPFEYFNGFNVSCYQCFDGSITVSNVSGGVGGYTYSWEPYGQTTMTISNLDAKPPYTLTIADANGCLFNPGEIRLSQPNRDDWTINGNDNIDDQSNFIGTIGASDLVIKTQSLERMRVDKNGNVGIGLGTDLPSAPLDVLGNVMLRSLSGGTGLTLIKTDADGILDKLPSSSSATEVLLGDGSWTDITQIFPAGANAWTIHANGNDIYRNSGNVGIGTTNPQMKLDVSGDVRVSNLEITGTNLKLNAFSGSNAIIKVDNTGLFSKTDIPNDPTKVLLGNGFFGNVPSATGWEVDNNNVNAWSTNTGCVAIGTNNFPTGNTHWPAQYKLAVSGKVIAEDFMVKMGTNWPDYVFKKDYKLRSIEELSTFIAVKNHLPGLPSASDIANSDLSLIEIVTKEMEKIEELTLYIIQFKNEIDCLKKENAQMKSKLNLK